MKVSKTLSSAVAATALVGAIGLAYAQTTDTTTQPAMPNSAGQTMQNQPSSGMTPNSSGQTMQNQPSSGMTPSPAMGDTSAMPIERPAQTDRN